MHGGDKVGARAELVGVLGLLDALGRPDDPAIPIALINLADLELEEGAPAKAEAHLVRALALSPSDGGKPHPRMAILETTLARARCELGRCEEALAGLDRANVAQAMLPPDHSDRIYPLLGRARVLVELGRGREAADAATDALARLAKLQAGPEDLGLVRVLHARALGLLGRRGQAVAEARRARAELVAAKLPTVDIDAFLERPRPRARRRR